VLFSCKKQLSIKLFIQKDTCISPEHQRDPEYYVCGFVPPFDSRGDRLTAVGARKGYSYIIK